MRFSLASFLALVVTVTASGLEARVCGDNCARALKNTLRHGAADCAALLTATIKPATVTKTRTSTTSITATVVVQVTATETVLQTTTETVDLHTPTAVPTFEKRSPSLPPLVLPAYATACDNAAAYTSACSCLGVFATQTVSQHCTPRVRVTVWETETVATETVTSTVNTSTITEVIATTKCALSGSNRVVETTTV